MSKMPIAGQPLKKTSPRKAIRKFCMDCQGDSPAAIVDCADSACPFHPIRSGHATPEERRPPARIIKFYCAEYCQSGESRAEIKNCQGCNPMGENFPCPIYPFRLGQNPKAKSA